MKTKNKIPDDYNQIYGEADLIKQYEKGKSEGIKEGASQRVEVGAKMFKIGWDKAIKQVLEIIEKVRIGVKKDLDNNSIRRTEKGIVEGTCDLIRLKIIQEFK